MNQRARRAGEGSPAELDLLTYSQGRFAQALLDAVERDEAVASVTSRRVYQVDSSEEWTSPQLVVEVDTTLNTEQAFAMMERMWKASHSLEERFGLPLLTAVVMLHWRPDAHQER
jgi:hypothetical protein